jgi:GTPase
LNGLREAFDLPGVPLRLSRKTSDNPYAGRRKPQR